ncbi:MAG: hypothetical protein ISS76_00875, partial [Phycisphaerae bacterium]|nr:hypothetical protein [Phycisphaerae bacterium]
PGDAATASTQAFVVDSAGAFTLAGPMSGTSFTVDAVDKLTIDGKLTASGAVDLQSSDNEVEINAEIDPATVTLDADDDVTINANITGTTSISAHAGIDGIGDVTFGAGVTLDAPIVTLQAGDGLGGNDTTAQVDILTNTPTVAANSLLTVKQDGQMGNDVIPWNPNVTNNATIDLNLQSDDSSIYTTDADSWKSITATAENNIELQGNGNINIASAGLSSTSGGVSILSNGGIISTPGAGGMLDSPITGYSDDSGKGVNWVVGSGKSAIVILSVNKPLTLGPNAILTANGSYGPSNDDRLDFLFNLSGERPGEKIDVAIYLGSIFTIDGDVEMGSGSVSIDNTSGVGTLMIDAFDTVTFTSAFEDSLADLRPDNVEWLEVISRSSPDLETVIGINPPSTLKLPYADNIENIAGGLYDGVYVLRGKFFFSTEVLAAREAVPLALSKPLEPEMQGEAEAPDMEAIAQLLDELGIGAQPFLARAYRPSLNTDLSLIKAAEKLLRLGPTLEDADGTRIAALIPLIRRISETPVPVEEQMTSFVQELARQELAGEWINALTEYAAILNNEIGLPANDSVARIMVRYGGKLTGPAENLFVEEYLAQTFAK